MHIKSSSIHLFTAVKILPHICGSLQHHCSRHKGITATTLTAINNGVNSRTALNIQGGCLPCIEGITTCPALHSTILLHSTSTTSHIQKGRGRAGGHIKGSPSQYTTNTQKVSQIDEKCPRGITPNALSTAPCTTLM